MKPDDLILCFVDQMTSFFPLQLIPSAVSEPHISPHVSSSYPLSLMITQLPAGKSQFILSCYNFPLFFSHLTLPHCHVLILFSLINYKRQDKPWSDSLRPCHKVQEYLSLPCWSIGASAFYLMYSFSVTGEFKFYLRKLDR
jgi:hypothetical protein